MLNRLAVLSAATAILSVSASAQYSLETISSPAPDLPAAYSAVIEKTGYRVAQSGGAWCEVWVRTSLPAGPKSAEDAISFPSIAQGTLLGVLRFPAQGADRRGQSIKSGLYTIRYSNYPVNGDHQGVAPQRDFLLLTPVAADPDPAAKPNFEQLVAMSRKASGTPHPAVLSIETPGDGVKAPSVAKEGEKDWTLTVNIGGTPVSIIVVGKSEA